MAKKVKAFSELKSKPSKKKNGRPELTFTDKQRETVTNMVAMGIRLADISACIGISDESLNKHFAQEINTSKAKAISALGQSLYQRGLAGSDTAAIFYLKTQGGWKETIENNHTHKITSVELEVIDAKTQS
jgi:hypothetical protein